MPILAHLLLALHAFAGPMLADEITLFSADGTPTAYIDTADELTIYMWDGTPVAYLESDGVAFDIYGFNGLHLGWFEDGIVRDHQGKVVGFIQGAVALPTKFEPFKAFKKFKPIQSVQRIPPVKPVYRDSWSSTPLSLFLLAGR
mgnify:CR=1 FL=1